MRKLLVGISIVTLLTLSFFSMFNDSVVDEQETVRPGIAHPVRISQASEPDPVEAEDTAPEGFHATVEQLDSFEVSVEPGEKFVSEGVEGDDGNIVFTTITPTLQSVDGRVLVVMSIERIEVEAGVEQTVSMPRLLMPPSQKGMIQSVVSDPSGKPVGGWSMQLTAGIGEEGRILLSGSTAMY